MYASANDGIRRVCWIVWTAAVITACTCGPVPCPQDTTCYVENSDDRCKGLETYLKCMKSLSKKCRGDIGYHSAITVSSAQYKRECSTTGGRDEFSRTSIDVTHAIAMIEPFVPDGSCPPMFDDKKPHRFCGLFGDPHLRTYDGKYQTCRIRGAWQVVDNPFFGIMATNAPVYNSTANTAPNKVTVVLRAQKLECTIQKVYEAVGDSQLPVSFNDGTTTSGPPASPAVSLSWRSNDNDSETVIIRVSYISTIITVTRVGKYLSVSTKLPEHLAPTTDPDKNELCSAGCPKSEQIPMKVANTSELSDVLSLCRNSVGPTGHRLTDQYLDWCVYDMMTSHDEQFINASHAAYSDVLFFEPRSLLNRTYSIFEPRPPQSTTDSSCTHGLNLSIVLIVTLYNFL